MARMVFLLASALCIAGAQLLASSRTDIARCIWTSRASAFTTFPPILDSERVVYASGNSIQCLSSQTGARQWAHKCASAFIGPPAMLGKDVFIWHLTGEAELLSMDNRIIKSVRLPGRPLCAVGSNGAIVSWQTDDAKLSVYNSSVNLIWKYDGIKATHWLPVVYENVAICVNDTSITEVSLSDKKVLWQTRIREEANNSAILAPYVVTTGILVPSRDRVVFVDLASGKVRWNVKVDEGRYLPACIVAVDAKTFAISSTHSISVHSIADGSEIWRRHSSANLNSGFVVFWGGKIWANYKEGSEDKSGGRLQAFDPKTGEMASSLDVSSGVCGATLSKKDLFVTCSDSSCLRIESN